MEVLRERRHRLLPVEHLRVRGGGDAEADSPGEGPALVAAAAVPLLDQERLDLVPEEVGGEAKVASGLPVEDRDEVVGDYVAVGVEKVGGVVHHL